MKIVIAGGSGFIGRPVVDCLSRRGEIVVLSRSGSPVKNARVVRWDPPAVGEWKSELRGAAHVLNFAGANVGEKRWSEQRKRELISSRLDSTRALVAAMREVGSTARFLGASAVGFYGSRGDEVLTEESAQGKGFLPDLAAQWEAAALEAASFASVALMRFGIVLAPDGGALEKMLPPFRLGLGGQIGNGRQWMSWIDRRDIVRGIEWLLDHPSERGAFNFTAPHPATNRDFTRALARALGRPALGWVPATPLKLAMGEMAEPLLLESQRALPRAFEASGFRFDYSSLTESLRTML